MTNINHTYTCFADNIVQVDAVAVIGRLICTLRRNGKFELSVRAHLGHNMRATYLYWMQIDMCTSNIGDMYTYMMSVIGIRCVLLRELASIGRSKSWTIMSTVQIPWQSRNIPKYCLQSTELYVVISWLKKKIRKFTNLNSLRIFFFSFIFLFIKILFRSW